MGQGRTLLRYYAPAKSVRDTPYEVLRTKTSNMEGPVVLEVQKRLGRNIQRGRVVDSIPCCGQLVYWRETM